MSDFGTMPSILITGGTGSFGRAFTRFVLEEKLAERVCIFSRGEHAQADLREELGNDERLRWFIGDIRDKERLMRAMAGCHLVIHAAALKRIEVGLYNPDEMIKTNVLGALNVVDAARSVGVARVVGLSTDKAFQPVSAYGTSKLMMEQIFQAANHNSGPKAPSFVLTRYGNVWGSAGSVLPKWLGMIRAGESEVPVTSLEATRYFMYMSEAIELVMGAAVHGERGSIAIPRLPAYRVGDLVEALGVRARVIGMGAWEKLHESMGEGTSSEAVRRLSTEELRDNVRWYSNEHGHARS